MKSEKQRKHLEKLAQAKLGTHLSEETKTKIGKANRGRKLGRFSEEHRVKLSIKKKMWWDSNPQQKEIFRKRFSGDKSNFWEGGVSTQNNLIRASAQYSYWRKSVYARDNYTCVDCGSIKNITADHIKPFAFFQELRFELSNGRTLCLDCHKKTDTWARGAYKYKEKQNV